MLTVIKSYDSSLTLDEGSRTVLAVISSDSVDRDAEVVSPKGMHKKTYSANPIVLFNHDKSSLPIGKALWIKSDIDDSGRGVIKAKYKITDKTEQGRAVFDLMKEGILTSHSLSFLSNHSSKPTTKEINERPELQQAKMIHRDWELLEFSVVTVPANPDAVALAISKGYSDSIIKLLGGNENKGIEPPKPEQHDNTQVDFSKSIRDAARNVKISVDIDKAITAAMARWN